MPATLEAELRRHRAWSITALVLLTLLAWYWIIDGAGMGMAPSMSLMPRAQPGSPMAGMDMGGAANWSGSRFALTIAMWLMVAAEKLLPHGRKVAIAAGLAAITALLLILRQTLSKLR